MKPLKSTIPLSNQLLVYRNLVIALTVLRAIVSGSTSLLIKIEQKVQTSVLTIPKLARMSWTMVSELNDTVPKFHSMINKLVAIHLTRDVHSLFHVVCLYGSIWKRPCLNASQLGST